MGCFGLTEPDYGSDVAGIKVTATPTADGGWAINGVKTWCTFGARANVLLLLARTDPDRSKTHRGLSLFLVPKPIANGHGFAFTQEHGDGSIGKMDGSPIEGDSLRKLVKRSRSMWINDSYWMLMPYKLRDPGVKLSYDGDTLIDGNTYDRLALAFENVGDTPGDHYWVYVNRANHRVERWDMVLEGDPPPAKSYTWEGWEQHDDLWFPTAHRGDGAIIYTRNVETVSKFGDQEFVAP